ncbi:hypothetical protein WJX84_005450 [Apatococcus fuscideae]|uniref:Uncharacterized protein n=1 Tax=Apatococcus fuscideae TaxID=2026836 RepID=A0AAW1T414_9CHLO
MHSSGQQKGSSRDGRASIRPAVAPSPLGRPPVTAEAAYPDRQDQSPPSSTPGRPSLMEMTMGAVTSVISRWTPARRRAKPVSRPEEPSKPQEQQPADNPEPEPEPAERDGSEYGTPEAQIRRSPSPSPSLPVSSGPAQAEATFPPRSNLAEALATADLRTATPLGYASAAAPARAENLSLPAVAQYQRLRQGSPLQLAPQELMQAAAHTPRTRFAFTPDHRAGHAPPSPAPGSLMQSVAGGPRFPTLAVRRGSSSLADPASRGASLFSKQPAPHRPSFGGPFSNLARPFAADSVPMRMDSANQAEVLRSQAAKRLQASDRPPSSAKRVRFNPPVPSAPTAGRGQASLGGTPLMGMGIQPSAYFSPAANRSRPAPLALPSPRQLAGAPLTDGPYARRRTLVDAAPSPMSALRTANAGRTPGPSRASGVKRPAGPEPSWAYRPQGPGEGQGVAAGTPPALLRGSEGEEGQAGAPSSKRPKYASPAAERFDNLVGKHLRDAGVKRDVYAELDAASPWQTPGKRSRQEPMPAPPMGSLSEAPAASAPWAALPSPPGQSRASAPHQGPHARASAPGRPPSRLGPAAEVDRGGSHLPPPADGFKAFSFQRPSQDSPPTPGLTSRGHDPAPDTASLPNGHVSPDEAELSTAPLPAARPAASKAADSDALLNGFSPIPERCDQPDYWSQPFKQSKPAQEAPPALSRQDGAAAKGEASIAQALPLPDSDTEDEPAVSSEDNDPAPAGSEDPFLSGQMSGDFGPPGSTAAASASTKPAPDLLGFLNSIAPPSATAAASPTGVSASLPAASGPSHEAPPKPAASGWGDAFMQSNKKAAAAAATDIEKEVEKAKGGTSVPKAPTPSASQDPEGNPAPAQPSSAFKFGTSGDSLPLAFGGATAASGPSFTFGATGSSSAFGGKGGFTFGASSAAAGGGSASQASAQPTSSVSMPANQAAASSAPFSFTFGQASGAGAASPAPLPFGAAQAGDSSNRAPAGSPKPGSTPVAIPTAPSPREPAATSLGSPSAYDAMSISPPQPNQPGPALTWDKAPASPTNPPPTPFSHGQANPNGPVPSATFPLASPGSQPAPTCIAGGAPSPAPTGTLFGSSTPAFGQGSTASTGAFLFGGSTPAFGASSGAPTSTGSGHGFNFGGSGGIGFQPIQFPGASAAASGLDAHSAPGPDWQLPAAAMPTSNGFHAPSSGGSSGQNPFANAGGGTAAASAPFGQGPPPVFGASSAPAFGSNQPMAFGNPSFTFGGDQAPAFGNPAASQGGLGVPQAQPAAPSMAMGAMPQGPAGMTLGAATGEAAVNKRRNLKVKRPGARK